LIVLQASFGKVPFTINLDNQHLLYAAEVYRVWWNRILAPKLCAKDLPIAKPLPDCCRKLV
jgi:hypothetical protein